MYPLVSHICKTCYKNVFADETHEAQLSITSITSITMEKEKHDLVAQIPLADLKRIVSKYWQERYVKDAQEKQRTTNLATFQDVLQCLAKLGWDTDNTKIVVDVPDEKLCCGSVALGFTVTTPLPNGGTRVRSGSDIWISHKLEESLWKAIKYEVGDGGPLRVKCVFHWYNKYNKQVSVTLNCEPLDE